MNIFEKDFKEYLSCLKNGKLFEKIKSYHLFDQCNLSFGSLVIIGGRTGVGKSTFALNLVKKIIFFAKEQKKFYRVFYFSLEMCKWELFTKLIAITKQEKLKNVSDGHINFREIYNEMINIYGLENLILIDDCFEIEEIITKIENMPKNSIIFIDYLGLAISYESDRYLKFGKFTRKLHQLAKTKGVCIICLCQLNRDADRDEFPELYHLKDSGTIEQDAEQVFLLYENDKKEFFIKVAKNRFGISGLVQKFDFKRDIATIDDF